MTIEEFIKKLQEYPKNYEVWVPDETGCFLLYPNIKVDEENVVICS
jgi:hypothetical protein